MLTPGSNDGAFQETWIDGEAVITYAVRTDPPDDIGAVQEICAEPFWPDAAETEEGALGAVLLIETLAGPEATDVPTSFVDVTVNVTVEPMVTPVRMQESSVVVQT